MAREGRVRQWQVKRRWDRYGHDWRGMYEDVQRAMDEEAEGLSVKGGEMNEDEYGYEDMRGQLGMETLQEMGVSQCAITRMRR